MREIVKRAVKRAFYDLAHERGFSETRTGPFDITTPKQEKFGDFSINLAMIIASKHHLKPPELAKMLAGKIAENDLFASASVAGPGFINLTIRPSRWVEDLGRILSSGDDFGAVTLGSGEKVIVEFVSANPTGPLHIGHGRGAVVGDVLARILRCAGYDVHSEYYINDVGLQMDNLGRSTLARCRKLLGGEADEPAYKGEYIIEIARRFIETKGLKSADDAGDDALAEARAFTAGEIMTGIRADLDKFRVHFDEWFSEASLHDSGAVERVIGQLQEGEHIYEHDGALWLKTQDAGDEKDRVVRRANGVTTYLAADIAYHKSKFDRNFSTLVNVWGADHHGYIPRMKAAVEALGYGPESLIVRLVQLVSLKKAGEAVAMSTRGGVFTTLREIIDEVGVDVTRYFFLMRSSDSHLEFDVDLAKKESSENPVYYIQYAHARCCNIFVTAGADAVERASFDSIDRALLEKRDEIRLIRKLVELPDLIESCALSFQPHPLTQYLTDVAALFHYFYKHNRVVTGDAPLTQARLLLVEAARIVLRNGLRLLGINAPERM